MRMKKREYAVFNKRTGKYYPITVTEAERMTKNWTVVDGRFLALHYRDIPEWEPMVNVPQSDSNG